MFERATWASFTMLALLGVLGCSSEPTDGAGESVDQAESSLNEARTASVASAASGAATVTTVPTFELTNVWYDDDASGRVKFLRHTGNKFFWEELYDVRPASFNLVWTLSANLTPNLLPGLLAGQGMNLTLRVGAKTLFRGTDLLNGEYFTSLATSTATSPNSGCASGKQCITTTIVGSEAAKFASTWDLALSYTSITFGIPSNTSTASVVTLPNKASFFKTKVEPIFRSERCIHCHSFGTPQALYDHHLDAFGSVPAGELVATDHGHRLECSKSCHEVGASVPGRTFAETKWMAPMSDMDIDWRTKNGRQICETVKKHLPTIAAMSEHFFEDGRIGWAVNDAIAPGNTVLSKSAPGNYSDFEDIMRGWIYGGMPCPQ